MNKNKIRKMTPTVNIKNIDKLIKDIMFGLVLVYMILIFPLVVVGAAIISNMFYDIYILNYLPYFVGIIHLIVCIFIMSNNKK